MFISVVLNTGTVNNYWNFAQSQHHQSEQWPTGPSGVGGEHLESFTILAIPFGALMKVYSIRMKNGYAHSCSYHTSEPSRQATAEPSFSRQWHLISWHTTKIQTVLSKHITPLKQTPQCSRGVLSTLQSSASHSHGDITLRGRCSAGQAPLQPGRQLRSDGQQALKCQDWQQLLESWQTPSPSSYNSICTNIGQTK